jgi:hypothetical protein
LGSRGASAGAPPPTEIAAIQRKVSQSSHIPPGVTRPTVRALSHWQIWLLPVVLTAVITFGLIVCIPDRSDPIYTIKR